MTSTETRFPHQSDQAAARPPANVVAASGGAQTTSRGPLSSRADAAGPGQPGTGAGTAAAQKAAARGPGGQFAIVSRTSRITELAKWIAGRRNFTFAEAAAASAPSPCSLAVMAYTLPDARLASGLAELGYLLTVGGKNGYTVTEIAPAASLRAVAGS